MFLTDFLGGCGTHIYNIHTQYLVLEYQLRMFSHTSTLRFLCECVCGGVRAYVCMRMWRSKDNCRVFSFYLYVGLLWQMPLPTEPS